MMFKRRALLIISLLAALISTSLSASAGFWEGVFGARAQATAAAPSRATSATIGQNARQRHAAAHASRKYLASHRRHKAMRMARAIPSNHGSAAHARPSGHATSAPTKRAAGEANQAVVAAKADETLKPGDIVSGADGLLVYVGEVAETGRRERFVPVERVGARLRKQLTAYANFQTPVSVPAHAEKQPVAKARTAALTALQAIDRYVSDARGRRIRFVGGSAPIAAD